MELDNNILFFVKNSLRELEDGFNLLFNEWDDYGYKTSFQLIFKKGWNETIIGHLKIGSKNSFGNTYKSIPKKFSFLSEEFYSVGMDFKYYENIKLLDDKYEYNLRVHILKSLNDISFNNQIYFNNMNEDIMQTSLLRSVMVTSILNQYNRIAHGGVELSEYNLIFKYRAFNKFHELNFNVNPNSIINTNVHAIIGKNGSGKTYMIKEIIKAVSKNHEYYTKNKDDSHFVNDINKDIHKTIVISYSIFDSLYKAFDKVIDERFEFWGYKDNTISLEDYFSDIFALGLKNIFQVKNKKQRWIKAIDTLNIDSDLGTDSISRLKYASYTDTSDMEEARTRFSTLSSGHKMTLSIITRIIEIAQEKTFIIIDEPEVHLHPELLSNFIKTLSFILKEINGISLLATHSPIVIREIPKNNCYILTRAGKSLKFERPLIETYGANINSVTSEAFRLSYDSSGYYEVIDDIVSRGDELNLDDLNNIGDEAMSYYYIKRYGNVKKNK